jgi:hypothetical protein
MTLFRQLLLAKLVEDGELSVESIEVLVAD